MSDGTVIDPQARAQAAAAGISAERLDALVARVRREVDEGLLPAVQIAIARNGAVAFSAAFGAAGPANLFSVFSATKALTASAGRT